MFGYLILMTAAGLAMTPLLFEDGEIDLGASADDVEGDDGDRWMPDLSGEDTPEAGAGLDLSSEADTQDPTVAPPRPEVADGTDPTEPDATTSDTTTSDTTTSEPTVLTPVMAPEGPTDTGSTDSETTGADPESAPEPDVLTPVSDPVTDETGDTTPPDDPSTDPSTDPQVEPVLRPDHTRPGDVSPADETGSGTLTGDAAAHQFARALRDAGASAAGVGDLGLTEATLVQGTTGSDSLALRPGGAPVTMVQGVADDGADAIQIVEMGAGNDTVSGAGLGARVFGGAGADVLSGTGALFGGTGSDEINIGGLGGYGHGGTGNDVLRGGAGNDILDGGNHSGTDTAEGDDDRIDGGDGDDTIRGGRGADVLLGGAGADVIDHMGTDHDRLTEPHRNFAENEDGAVDVLNGGEGNDLIRAGAGDIVTTGTGNDVVHIHAGSPGAAPTEVTDFTPGEDFLRVTMDPHAHSEPLEVEVTPSEDGADAIVRVNGTEVAVLRGAPEATAWDIYAEVPPDI